MARQFENGSHISAQPDPKGEYLKFVIQDKEAVAELTTKGTAHST